LPEREEAGKKAGSPNEEEDGVFRRRRETVTEVSHSLWGTLAEGWHRSFRPDQARSRDQRAGLRPVVFSCTGFEVHTRKTLENPDRKSRREQVAITLSCQAGFILARTNL
jgi:hypothetical protein